VSLQKDLGGALSRNRFCFVVPCFNASKTLARCLHSVAVQSYTNWRLILIDDMSSVQDATNAIVTVDLFNHMLRLSKVQDVFDERIELHVNKEKKWEVANVLHGISMCEDNDIVCRLDADDYLCDADALMIMNTAYEQTKCDVAWSMHRWGFSDRNISGPLTPGIDVYKHPWCTSHLKTFRKYLLNDVPYENFLNMNGELVRRAGDQCVFLPVLSRCSNPLFVQRVLYHYEIDEHNGAVYQTEDAKFQKQEADFLRARGYVETGVRWQEVIS